VRAELVFVGVIFFPVLYLIYKQFVNL
jgi:hypothetical protein